MQQKNRLFIIENITNMHVGSGETNFGIVDNLVQRDVTTNFPTIHSSSLKGALREFFENKYTEDNSFIRFIFGGNSKEEEKENKNQPGQVKFFEASFLGMPFRSSGVPYVFGTTILLLKQLLDFSEKLGIRFKGDDKIRKLVEDIKQTDKILINRFMGKDGKGEYIEDYKITKDNEDERLEILAEFFGEDYVTVLPEDTFKGLVEDLPVIARNKLENGISVNLFYEEIVPKKSRFFTAFAFPENVNGYDKSIIENYIGTFLKDLTDEKNILQIGANASIGYGICNFKDITLEELKNG